METMMTESKTEMKERSIEMAIYQSIRLALVIGHWNSDVAWHNRLAWDCGKVIHEHAMQEILRIRQIKND